MKQIKLLIFGVALLGVLFSCSKTELDIKNPNQPTPASAATEPGIIAYAQGGVYVNGFQAGSGIKFGGFNGNCINDPYGYHEMFADVIADEAANQHINEIGSPDYVILDDGTKVLNPVSSHQERVVLRENNTNSNQGDNPVYYEWAYMYSLNKACNRVLALVDKVTFSGDAATKKAAVKAWSYWWKGYAYSRIGSIYYAGLIDDTDNGTNGNYVTKEAIITEANANFDKAVAALGAATSTTDYNAIIGALIPDIFQKGKGGIPTPDMWKRNISTMKARNLLANTPTASMTAAQWGTVLSLANAGITATDNVFTARSNAASDFFSPSSGTIAAGTIGKEAGFRISERFLQDFKAGDKRFLNNFDTLTAPWIGNSDRGNAFNTRFYMVDGGKGMKGVSVYGSHTAGAEEFYFAGTYEENQLMIAEAKINTGDIAGGLKIVDDLRTLGGAGLDAVAAKVTALLDAKEELRRERRVQLPFRGISFYDARRWGISNDISKGGGRTNVNVVDAKGKLNTKVTINYNYLDYFDVPDTELAYNPAAAGSAPTKNPN